MEASKNLTGEQTVKFSQLIKYLKDGYSHRGAWFEEGVECEFLNVREGKGWQTGKIRIRFEFIPDVIEPMD